MQKERTHHERASARYGSRAIGQTHSWRSTRPVLCQIRWMASMQTLWTERNERCWSRWEEASSRPSAEVHPVCSVLDHAFAQIWAHGKARCYARRAMPLPSRDRHVQIHWAPLASQNWYKTGPKSIQGILWRRVRTQIDLQTNRCHLPRREVPEKRKLFFLRSETCGLKRHNQSKGWQVVPFYHQRI